MDSPLVDSPLAILDAFEIRCKFEPKLVEEAGGTVSLHVLTRASELGDLVHPWCHRNGEPVGWDFRGAMPISVRDLLGNDGLVTPDRAKSIANTAQSLSRRREYGSHQPVLVQVTILTYDLNDGVGRLLLDGSHRLAALALLLQSQKSWPFKVLEVRIHGPVMGEICPDLYHHAGGVPEHLLKD